MSSALSLAISAIWVAIIALAWVQAKSALARPVLMVPSSCRTSSFLGSADAERAPERRTMTEVSCILETV